MDLVRTASLLAIVLLSLSFESRPAAAQNPIYCGTRQWRSFIDEAAARTTLPSVWLHSVIAAESAGCEFTDGRPTTSAMGAMGLMQLMPATWERFRTQLDLGPNAYDPHDNILAGAAYLQELLARYGWPAAAAAYHAGPARFDEHLRSGRALPGATVEYLARIDRALAKLPNDARNAVVIGTPSNAIRALFVGRDSSDPPAERALDRTSNDSLFVTLRHAKPQMGRIPAEPGNVQQK